MKRDYQKQTGVVVYGVSGVMEWNALIRVGEGVISIPFRHGSYTGFSSQSAEYRTDRPFYQMVIENSALFKDGKIHIINDYREKSTSPDEEPKMEEDKGDNHQDEEEDEGSSNLEEVPIPSQEDAKAYLIEKFGFKAQGLRSKTAIREAAKSNGIKFICPELD